jgi:RNA polymerase sigma-70 factor (ECF subfamily)
VRYAARITRDVERARDVVQDTFLRLCRQDQADVDGHLAEWLFTVCRNRALDVRRKEGRMKILTERAAAAQTSHEPDQAAVAECHDTARHIQTLVDGLPDNQQDVVRLKFQNGLSYREISRITELSVSNVGYLIHTALKKIRAEVRVELDGRTS